jgi:hypothetical protein
MWYPAVTVQNRWPGQRKVQIWQAGVRTPMLEVGGPGQGRRIGSVQPGLRPPCFSGMRRCRGSDTSLRALTYVAPVTLSLLERGPERCLAPQVGMGAAPRW